MKYKTIPQMFYSVINANPNKNIFNYKKDNDWIPLKGSEIKTIVENISASLLYHEITKNDKIAILSTTSYKWALCDYGILCSGAVTTTVYPTLIDDQVLYILNNSESKIIFVENKLQLIKIQNILQNCDYLNLIVVMDDSYDGDNNKIINFSSFLNLGSEYKKDKNLNVEDISMNVKTDDLVTLIYTSGTTGTPKGVMLSHGNIISNLYAVKELQDNIFDERFLSFLPLSHILERMAGHFFAMAVESEIYYAENMETVGANMFESSPSIVVCVPRFFEKMHDKIMLGLSSASSNKVKLFNWALKLGKDFTNIKHAGRKPNIAMIVKYKIANALIYSKVRAKLGGNIKFFISGGAPLSRNVAEFFAGIGITILEGYGLTETSPVLTSNTPESIRFGYVGKPISNVNIKIANDGEILAQGPNIMLGYYKNQEETDKVIDKEGWFHTGDIGEIDKDGFVKITDRKKSLIVTSAGKNIAPAPMENALTSSKYIDQAMVIGDKRNFISSLIVPSYDNINLYLKSISKDTLSNQAIIDHPKIIELITNEINDCMTAFSSYEKVKKFKLLANALSIERGELTPKMSIVRKKVLENYSELIDTIYN